MNVSDYGYPLLGATVVGGVGYLARGKATDALIGAAVGGVGVALLTGKKAASLGPEAPPPADRIIAPPPPSGRPVIPQEAQAMFAGHGVTMACQGAHRSYYGVRNWGKKPGGHYEPDWVLLGRWLGNQLTESMLPFLDQYYGKLGDCAYAQGVWAVGVACDGSYQFYPIGRSSFECGAVATK